MTIIITIKWLENYSLQRFIAKGLAGSTLLALAPFGFALQTMSDNQLANITGQDGLTVTVETPSMGLSLRHQLDANTDYEASMMLQNITYTPVLSNGGEAPSGSLARLITTFDVGGALDGTPMTRTTLDLNRMRFHVEDIDLYGKSKTGTTYGPVARVGSFGELAMDASGELEFINAKGLFYADENSEYAHLYGKLSNTNMFYRQEKSAQAPYLLF